METYLAKHAISGEHVYTLEISSVTDNQSGETFYMVTSKPVPVDPNYGPVEPDFERLIMRRIYPSHDHALAAIEWEMEEQAFFHVFSRIK